MTTPKRGSGPSWHPATVIGRNVTVTAAEVDGRPGVCAGCRRFFREHADEGAFRLVRGDVRGHATERGRGKVNASVWPFNPSVRRRRRAASSRRLRDDGDPQRYPARHRSTGGQGAAGAPRHRARGAGPGPGARAEHETRNSGGAGAGTRRGVSRRRLQGPRLRRGSTRWCRGRCRGVAAEARCLDAAPELRQERELRQGRRGRPARQAPAAARPPELRRRTMSPSCNRSPGRRRRTSTARRHRRPRRNARPVAQPLPRRVGPGVPSCLVPSVLGAPPLSQKRTE